MDVAKGKQFFYKFNFANLFLSINFTKMCYQFKTATGKLNINKYYQR